MKHILIAIISALLIFSLASFVEVSLDFREWEKDTRLASALGWLAAWLVSWAFYEASVERELESYNDEKKNLD